MSAIRSSTCSMPTDSRTMSTLTPALASSSGAELAVRGGGRVAGERLRVADVDQSREQLQRVLEPRAALEPALHAEADDAAGLAAEVLLHQAVVGVVGQARVVHPADLRMLFQVLGDRHRVLADAVHAQRERLDALQDQEGVHRRECRAHVAKRHHTRAADVGCRAQRLGVDDAVVRHIGFIEPLEARLVLRPRELAGVDDRAADAVAVAAEVLGQRVHDDVGAVFERAAQVGARHRVVDDQRDAVAVCDVGELRQVGDVAERVADRLAVDRLRLRVDQRLERVRHAVVGETHLDAELREGVREQVVGAAVERGGRDDVVARLGDGLDRIADRRHARGHGERGDAAFELGQALLEHRVGRVHDPRVDVARDLQVEQVGAVLRVVERVGDGLVDRHRDGLGRRVRVLAAVHGDGFDLQGESPGCFVGVPNVSGRPV